MQLHALFDNRLNPILIRELRQMVRNRFVVVMLNLYIALLVFVCLSMVLFGASSLHEGLGEGLFASLAGIMGGASLLVVCIYTAFVTAGERINADLMYSSSLRPSQIVWGKFCSGLVLSLLLFSAVFPFFTLAYLLRGLDLNTFFATVYLIFLGIHTVNSGVLSMACNIKTPIQMIFTGLIGLVVGVPCLLQLIGILIFSRLFRGAPLLDWVFLLNATLIALSLIGFFLTAGVVSVSPVSSNRMLPMRLYISVWFLLSFLYCLFATWLNATSYAMSDVFNAWCVLHALILTCCIPIVASERDHWNVRIRRSIPRSFLFRQFVFPFYTGVACGLFWILLYAGLLFGVFLFFADFPGFDTTDFLTVNSLILFTFDYFFTAALIRMVWFPTKIRPTMTWVVVLGLLTIFSCGTIFLHFLFNYNANEFLFDKYDESILSMFNPFVIFYHLSNSRNEICLQTLGAILWFVVLAPFLLYWFVARSLEFRNVSVSEIGTTDSTAVGEGCV